MADDESPETSAVHYPGLASHDNHAVAADQMADFGGMVSFELAGGVDEAATFAASLDVFRLAESLGGVESLCEVPAAMTHQDLSPSELAAAGIDESLVRLSVGIEGEDDLLMDLDRALDAAVGEEGE